MDKIILEKILNTLRDKQVLRVYNGFYEVKHDSLAAKINFRRTTEEKKRIEATQMIYNTNRTEGWLSEKQLARIEPYRSRLLFKAEDKDEMERWIFECEEKIQNEKKQEIESKRKLQWQRNRARAGFALAVLGSIVAFTVYWTYNRESGVDRFEGLKRAYENGDQWEVKEAMKKVDTSEKNNIYSVFTSIYRPRTKILSDSLRILGRQVSLLDSFYNIDPSQITKIWSKRGNYYYIITHGSNADGYSRDSITVYDKNNSTLLKDLIGIQEAFFSDDDSLLSYVSEYSKEKCLVKLFNFRNPVLKSMVLYKKNLLDPIKTVRMKFDSTNSTLYLIVNQSLLYFSSIHSSGSFNFEYICRSLGENSKTKFIDKNIIKIDYIENKRNEISYIDMSALDHKTILLDTISGPPLTSVSVSAKMDKIVFLKDSIPFVDYLEGKIRRNSYTKFKAIILSCDFVENKPYWLSVNNVDKRYHLYYLEDNYRKIKEILLPIDIQKWEFVPSEGGSIYLQFRYWWRGYFGLYNLSYLK